MPTSPRKRRCGSAISCSPSTTSTPSSPSTWPSPCPPVLTADQITAETVSRDGSRSVRAIQFPGAVLLHYSDLRTGALHVRAGGARAAAAALEPGRFDDADPDVEERWSGSGRHHFQDQLSIAPAVMRSFRSRIQAQDTTDAADPEPEGHRSRSFSCPCRSPSCRSFSMEDSGRAQFKSEGVLLGWSRIDDTSRLLSTSDSTSYSPSIEPSWLEPDLDDAE